MMDEVGVGPFICNEIILKATKIVRTVRIDPSRVKTFFDVTQRQMKKTIH